MAERTRNFEAAEVGADEDRSTTPMECSVQQVFTLDGNIKQIEAPVEQEYAVMNR